MNNLKLFKGSLGRNGPSEVKRRAELFIVKSIAGSKIWAKPRWYNRKTTLGEQQWGVSSEEWKVIPIAIGSEKWNNEEIFNNQCSIVNIQLNSSRIEKRDCLRWELNIEHWLLNILDSETWNSFRLSPFLVPCTLFFVS